MTRVARKTSIAGQSSDWNVEGSSGEAGVESVCVTRSGSSISLSFPFPLILWTTSTCLWHLFQVFVSVEGDKDDDPQSVFAFSLRCVNGERGLVEDEIYGFRESRSSDEFLVCVRKFSRSLDRRWKWISRTRKYAFGISHAECLVACFMILDHDHYSEWTWGRGFKPARFINLCSWFGNQELGSKILFWLHTNFSFLLPYSPILWRSEFPEFLIPF